MTTIEKAPKTKYPRAAAIEVARQLCGLLTPCCARIMVAGSLRRRKAEVGDVEILYLPNMVKGKDPGDLFGKEVQQNAVDVALDELLRRGLLEKRESILRRTSWGKANKFAVHVASGIPVDLFAATHENWWNLVVCRTGGMQSNIAICEAAIGLGWKWEPYSAGFTRPSREKGAGWLDVKACKSEREVFDFVDLPYKPPEERE